MNPEDIPYTSSNVSIMTVVWAAIKAILKLGLGVKIIAPKLDF